MDLLTKTSGYDLAGLVCGSDIVSRDRDIDLKRHDLTLYVNARLARLSDLFVLSVASAELAVPNSLASVKYLNDFEEATIFQKDFGSKKTKSLLEH